MRLDQLKGNTAQIWKCLCVGQAAKQNHSHVIFSLGFEMLWQDTNTIYGVSKSPNVTSRVSDSQNYYLKGSETVSYILGCVSHRSEMLGRNMVKRRGVEARSGTERKKGATPISFYSTLSGHKFCLSMGFPGYFEP